MREQYAIIENDVGLAVAELPEGQTAEQVAEQEGAILIDPARTRATRKPTMPSSPTRKRMTRKTTSGRETVRACPLIVQHAPRCRPGCRGLPHGTLCLGRIWVGEGRGGQGRAGQGRGVMTFFRRRSPVTLRDARWRLSVTARASPADSGSN